MPRAAADGRRVGSPWGCLRLTISVAGQCKSDSRLAYGLAATGNRRGRAWSTATPVVAPAARRTTPEMAVTQLRQLQEAEDRTTGPVFATRDGNELDAANVRREFRAAVKAAGITGTWSPRELRHTFVSLMSDSGVPVEEIARLAGHASSRTTELVYRHQLKPIMEKGAEAMDRLFTGAA